MKHDVDPHQVATAAKRLRDDHSFKILVKVLENSMDDQDEIMRKTDSPEAWRKAQGFRMGLQELIDFVHNDHATPTRTKSRDHF